MKTVEDLKKEDLVKLKHVADHLSATLTSIDEGYVKVKGLESSLQAYRVIFKAALATYAENFYGLRRGEKWRLSILPGDLDSALDVKLVHFTVSDFSLNSGSDGTGDTYLEVFGGLELPGDRVRFAYINVNAERLEKIK